MGDKRIDKMLNAMTLNITALMQCDRKAKPHEMAYALIESAFWVMAEEKGRYQYLDEVFSECAHRNAELKQSKVSD